LKKVVTDAMFGGEKIINRGYIFYTLLKMDKYFFLKENQHFTAIIK